MISNHYIHMLMAVILVTGIIRQPRKWSSINHMAIKCRIKRNVSLPLMAEATAAAARFMRIQVFVHGLYSSSSNISKILISLFSPKNRPSGSRN